MDDNTMNIAYHNVWAYENEEDIDEDSYEDEMTSAEFEWESREGR